MLHPVGQENGRTRTSIFYLNDLHGQNIKMERLYNASRAFDAMAKKTNQDVLKLASGDTFLGANKKANTVAAKFLDFVGITASAVGNHECDDHPQTLADLVKDKTFKLLGLNARIEKDNPLKNIITGSKIEERDGDKYGIIGLMPVDLHLRIENKNGCYDGVQVANMDETIKDVQTEINRLKEQGINKIIVLSHIGNANEKKLAQETSGIDVILGGHSHELIDGVKEGENLFYTKTGEPVIITQAGKDADNFGVLNIEFDKEGIIKKVQNSISKTKDFKRSLSMRYLCEQVLGKPETVGFVKSAEPEPENRLLQENPHANFVCDVLKKNYDTDIAIINAANFRGALEAGPINAREVNAIAPFKDRTLVSSISEKNLVESLKIGTASIKKPDSKPGVLMLSGIRYAYNKQGELLSADFVNKEGEIIPIDIKNPSETKMYTVATNEFCAQGRDGFAPLKIMDKVTFITDKGRDEIVCDYLKEHNEPLEIKCDGRIKIVD